MSEPEVALVFTPEPWVEELHRHLTDHGGARVRSLIIEPRAALEEAYDVLVVSHKWGSLTQGFVTDVRGRGHAVLGVYDREEPAGRRHLAAVGVNAIIESDVGLDAFVAAVFALQDVRGDTPAPPAPPERPGRLVVVGGAPGVGRTEVAVQLAISLHARRRVVLLDADDVGPAIAQRLSLPIEPNLRTAVDAVEHGRSDPGDDIVSEPRSGLRVVPGLVHPHAWTQIRPGEVMRVVDRLGHDAEIVVVDGVGMLEEVGPVTRGRFATARALVVDADVIVGVCDATPTGIVRFLQWSADVRLLGAMAPLVALVNRGSGARFRRGELYEELAATVPLVETVFAPNDERVRAAAWDGRPVARGAFTRALEQLGEVVDVQVRRRRASTSDETAIQVAS